MSSSYSHAAWWIIGTSAVSSDKYHEKKKGSAYK